MGASCGLPSDASLTGRSVCKGERSQKLSEIFLRNIWIIPSQPVIADSWGCHFSESEKKAASVFLFPLRASLKHSQRFPTMIETTLMNLKNDILSFLGQH